MTTFIEELDEIIESHLPEMFNALTPLNGLSTKVEARDAILNLVSERIIGEVLKPIDVGALTGPSPASSHSLTLAQGAYLTAYNGLVNKQRTTLYEGTKEKSDE